MAEIAGDHTATPNLKRVPFSAFA